MANTNYVRKDINNQTVNPQPTYTTVTHDDEGWVGVQTYRDYNGNYQARNHDNTTRTPGTYQARNHDNTPRTPSAYQRHDVNNNPIVG
tara:strand:- start:659 stop:922 length:264 start_codon:yes stop_codon:yes gene_type:complete